MPNLSSMTDRRRDKAGAVVHVPNRRAAIRCLHQCHAGRTSLVGKVIRKVVVKSLAIERVVNVLDNDL